MLHIATGPSLREIGPRFLTGRVTGHHVLSDWPSIVGSLYVLGEAHPNANVDLSGSPMWYHFDSVYLLLFLDRVHIQAALMRFLVDTSRRGGFFWNSKVVSL